MQLHQVLAVGFTRLGNNHQAFGTVIRIDAAKCGDPSGANAIDITHAFFQLMRINIAAGADDDVFNSAGQINFAVGDVCQVT